MEVPDKGLLAAPHSSINHQSAFIFAPARYLSCAFARIFRLFTPASGGLHPLCASVPLPLCPFFTRFCAFFHLIRLWRAKFPPKIRVNQPNPRLFFTFLRIFWNFSTRRLVRRSFSEDGSFMRRRATPSVPVCLCPFAPFSQFFTFLRIFPEFI